MDTQVKIAVFVSIIATFVLSKVLFGKKSKLPPNLKPVPGPKRIPIMGNAHIMPRKKEWETFQAWTKTYGDFISLKVFQKNLIVVNSFDKAIDLCEKRGAIYSSRPNLIMCGKLMGFELTLPLMKYDDQLRNARRLAHRTLSARPVREYLFGVEQEGGRFLRRLQENPADWEQSVRETCGAMCMKALYGYQAGGKIDPFVHLFEEALHEFSQAIAPGAFMVDFFPILLNVPSWMLGGGYKKVAAHGRHMLFKSARAGFLHTKHSMENGTALPSMVRDGLEQANAKTGKEKKDMEFLTKWTAAALGGAGADTPVSAMLFWVLAMTVYPDVQKKARDELDAVVGRERVPTLEDRPRLPYINALIKEVLRWYPIAPVGVPHVSQEDDEYEGMFIPKNTALILNQWAMLNDEKYFPNPRKFDPERYIGPNRADKERAGDPVEIAFGFGRRVCPGQHLGDAMLFCAIAKCLSTFEIKYPLDKDGKEYVPEVDCLSGNVAFPKPFDCRFIARDQLAHDVIHRDTEELVAGDGLPKDLEPVPEEP